MDVKNGPFFFKLVRSVGIRGSFVLPLVVWLYLLFYVYPLVL